MKKRILTLGIFCVIVAVAAMAQDGAGKNIDAMLRQILTNQQTMQDSIQTLQTKINKQEDEISALKKQLKVQEEAVQVQAEQLQVKVKELEDRPIGNAGPNVLDILAAREQYELARDLQHHTIFNVRKGLQKEWFERVVSEFQAIVDNYPEAPEVPQALIRIGRTYHRYLDKSDLAKEAFNKVLSDYPQTKEAIEARETLAKM